MEADGDQLDEDLLDEIEDGPDEDDDDDLVDSVLPAPRALIAVDVVVLHRGQERNLHAEPPEKQRCMELELLGHVAPFLRVVGEDTGEDTDHNRHTLSDELDNLLATV